MTETFSKTRLELIFEPFFAQNKTEKKKVQCLTTFFIIFYQELQKNMQPSISNRNQFLEILRPFNFLNKERSSFLEKGRNFALGFFHAKMLSKSTAILSKGPTTIFAIKFLSFSAWIIVAWIPQTSLT